MSSAEERLWWCILLDADLLSEIASNRGDGPLAVRYMKVGNKARVTLRDKFGINLDDVTDEARQQVHILEAAELQKERDEESMSRKLDEILASARELLDK